MVSTDRGLCGGLNINLFKRVLANMSDWNDKDVEIDLCVIGNKATAFFRKYGGSVVAKAGNLGDTPAITDLIGTVKVMLNAYDEGRLDRLYVVYNKFVNTMTQEPVVEQLLPLPVAEDENLRHHWDYIYEPEAKPLLDKLMVRFVESQVYQSVVENIACGTSSANGCDEERLR